jgi:peptidoglycan L-alanyl-D-glutamate endopeptidase CwlK
MNSLDQKSLDLLRECDDRLAAMVREAALITPFDFRVVQTSRTIAQQREYFRAGTSRVNPDAYVGRLGDLYEAAKHVTGPGMPKSRAVDVALVGKEPYHVPSLCYLAGVMRTLAHGLNMKIRWGGDFDRDGLLLEPGTFHDLPHFEID